MMMVVMGEILDFREKGDVATPHGIIEWRQDKWIDDEVASVQIAVLEKTLGAKVSRIKDDFGRVCFTADTEVPPIVWGSLSHALKIWRFIPEIELPWAVNELLYDRWVRSRSGKELRIVGGISSLDDDQEEGDEFEVRYRIRGRFSRDKK